MNSNFGKHPERLIELHLLFLKYLATMYFWNHKNKRVMTWKLGFQIFEFPLEDSDLFIFWKCTLQPHISRIKRTMAVIWTNYISKYWNSDLNQFLGNSQTYFVFEKIPSYHTFIEQKEQLDFKLFEFQF